MCARGQGGHGRISVLQTAAKASHGVAADSSPRRKPWDYIENRCQPRKGRQNSEVPPAFLSPLRGSEAPMNLPTTFAVGYSLSLLRSYWPLLPKTEMRPTGRPVRSWLASAVSFP